jgi:hypothetical protein
VGPSVFRQGTCDRGIWRKPLAFAADAEGYIDIKVWGFNGRFAISSPSGLANFMHRRILSPAVELLHHPTQPAAPEHAIASAAPAASCKSPFRLLTPKKANEKRKLVQTPVFASYTLGAGSPEQ